MLDQLITEAQQRHAKYPQYQGYFEDNTWFLVRAHRDVRTRMGIVLRKGEYAIAQGREPSQGKAVVTIHSPITSHQHVVYLGPDVRTP